MMVAPPSIRLYGETQDAARTSGCDVAAFGGAHEP